MKVKMVVPPEVPHDTRICIEGLVDVDFDESDVVVLETNHLEPAPVWP